MNHRLNPHEGYRRCAMLVGVFGQLVANELKDKADMFCQGDIETLLQSENYTFSDNVPIREVRKYFMLEDVSDIEDKVPLSIKQLALLRADVLYKLYLESMKG